MYFIGVVLAPFLMEFYQRGNEKAGYRTLKSRICDLCSVAFEGFLSLQRMQVASGPSIISIIPPLIFMEMASICKRLVVQHHINYLQSLWLDCLFQLSSTITKLPPCDISLTWEKSQVEVTQDNGGTVHQFSALQSNKSSKHPPKHNIISLEGFNISLHFLRSLRRH